MVEVGGSSSSSANGVGGVVGAPVGQLSEVGYSRSSTRGPADLAILFQYYNILLYSKNPISKWDRGVLATVAQLAIVAGTVL
jgi:hypothetical protein